MIQDAHGNYYWDLFTDERGHFAVFTPLRRYDFRATRFVTAIGMDTETRGPFKNKEQAVAAVAWLACEWGYGRAPVAVDSECGEGEGK